MKKLLILIVIVLLTTLTCLTIFKGLQVGSLQILGIYGMKEKNDQLDNEISKATKLASADFPKTITDLNESEKKLLSEKQSYEDMTAVSTDTQIQQASQLKKYELEKLYIQLGGHAKSEGLKLSMEIVASNSLTNAYNINCKVTGPYIGVTDFIADVEEDSTLGFKIENFAMTSNGNAGVEATFECKDIMINGITTDKVTEEKENENEENPTNNTTNNTTNSTSKTTSNSNTTNSVNENTTTSNNTTDSTNTAR